MELGYDNRLKNISDLVFRDQELYRLLEDDQK